MDAPNAPLANLSNYYVIFYASKGIGASGADVGHAREQLEPLRRAVEERFGFINEFYAERFRAAAWFGDQPSLRVWSFYNTPKGVPASIDHAMRQLSTFEDSARSLLSNDPPQLRRCLDVIFSGFGQTLGAADVWLNGASTAELRSREILNVEAAVEEARQILNALTQRRAQFDYFKGMVAGAGALAVFAVLLILAAPWLPRTDIYAVDTLAGCIFGGSLGSVFSVLSRLTSGRLRLQPDAGTVPLLILGGVRPVVGAVAGVALFFFVDGQAFDILSQPDESARAYSYYAALAFLAGFSERWFQDMLSIRQSTSVDPPPDASTTTVSRTSGATGIVGWSLGVPTIREVELTTHELEAAAQSPAAEEAPRPRKKTRRSNGSSNAGDTV